LFRKLIDSFLRGKPADSVAAPVVRQRLRISNPWHAVSIVPQARACRLARSFADVRFLSRDAPNLPLADCTVRPCTCHYRHFQDRRTSLRRDSELVGSRLGWAGHERRVSRGRRSTDHS
jgi:hypothetical protein